MPPRWGYLLCALVVIALVLVCDPGAFAGVTHYGGESGLATAFSLLLFGAALTVGMALPTPMGEQADCLRFMPRHTAANRWRWCRTASSPQRGTVLA